MSKETVYEFLSQTRVDETLRSGFESQGNLDDIVAYAGKNGYEFSATEFHEGAMEVFEENDVELTEEQLEAAAGGLLSITIWNCGQSCGDVPA
ncbi:MAG: Nif11-like leader peptide family natural product precursor, partial [Anaerolineae bacterium]|nr:Nif11-like leader peptide family natural product precursor [Anaerolineae bacterium]